MKQGENAGELCAENRSRSGLAAAFIPCILIACFLAVSFFSARPSFASSVDPAKIACRVVFVADDDTLSVRSKPGAKNPLIGELPPNASGVYITGDKRMVGKDAWYYINAGGIQGWVSGKFLTEDVSRESFCGAPPINLLEDLKKAIRDRDGSLLASLVHKDRSLRLHVNYANKGVRIPQSAVSSLFSDSKSINWGEDHNSEPLQGSFAAVVLPVLDQDLLGGAETACNTMRLDGSTGELFLPWGTNGVNFYSFHRMGDPPDWGAWIVGVEHWEGSYYISYLAHYQWEP